MLLHHNSYIWLFESRTTLISVSSNATGIYFYVEYLQRKGFVTKLHKTPPVTTGCCIKLHFQNIFVKFLLGEAG